MRKKIWGIATALSLADMKVDAARELLRRKWVA